jgi:hypothetical protein
MSIGELLRWQYAGYEQFHRARVNLLLHIVVVPLFLVANVALIVACVRRDWVMVVIAAVSMVVSVAMQGRGHGREENPPQPFSGPANAVARIFFEQWVTFPRFFFSGGWARALRRAGNAVTSESQANS